MSFKDISGEIYVPAEVVEAYRNNWTYYSSVMHPSLHKSLKFCRDGVVEMSQTLFRKSQAATDLGLA